MSKLRISAANTFALEMVRAALCHSSIPGQYRLTGMWMHMDMETGNDFFKSVALLIKIHGADSKVQANCQVESENGVWVRGTCAIALVKDVSQRWEFSCEVDDNKIDVTPVIAPQASV